MSELIELLHDARFRLENMGSTDETDAELVDRIMKQVDILRARAVPDVPELVRYRLNSLGELVYSENGSYVLHSQAAAIIAAKDAENERLREALKKIHAKLEVDRTGMIEGLKNIINLALEGDTNA